MKKKKFVKELQKRIDNHKKLIGRRNEAIEPGNGIFTRYVNPVLTAAHAPLFWRYDFDPETNPFLMERMGINAAFNAGAIEFNGKYCVMARVEGWDRKSFFAVAESPTGIDQFKFWDYPVMMPETDNPETNVYDMRLVNHEDGWIYGLFCAERHDSERPGVISAATASCGIARTKDLQTWERLPDLQSNSKQQRNCVLHPEFVNGKYAFYTRPLQDFAATGSGEGIGWGLCDDIQNALLDEEIIIDKNIYHTIKEGKNGLGPAPIKTEKGWLHLAHGVRDTAAGMRYVLYLFLADLADPSKIIKHPGGYFLAPEGAERVGDVSNVVFSNGWIVNKNQEVFIYYGASDTYLYCATSTVDQLLDYVMNTPEDGLHSSVCVQQRRELITKNLAMMKALELS